MCGCGAPLADRSIDYAVAIHVLQDLAWGEIPAALLELHRADDKPDGPVVEAFLYSEPLTPQAVTALKGYMGNLVSGCGSVELIASLVGVNRGYIPPTINCDEPDPACKVDIQFDLTPL